jgi:hypothetical protein
VHPFRRALPLIALAGFAAAAAPAHAASSSAKVKASVVKPLTLSSVQSLDLGTIVLGPGTWSGAKVKLSQAGQLTCTNANLTCTGATQVAKYKVTGSNNQVARITAPNVTMVNQNDTTKTLTLVVDSPGTVTFPNSGNQGITFSLGGEVTIDSTTAGGLYSGTFNVTVDY